MGLAFPTISEATFDGVFEASGTDAGILRRNADGTYEVTNDLYPPADSTTAIEMFKADKTTSIFAADTTNAYFVFGKRGSSVPLTSLHVIDDVDTLAHKYPRGILCDSVDNSQSGVHLGTYKARGVRGTPLALLDGDFLAATVYTGYDGSEYIDAVSMGCFRDTMSGGARWGEAHTGNWGDNPSMITSFYILTQSTTGYSMRFFIDPYGNFGVGRNNILPEAQLDVRAEAATSTREDLVRFHVDDCTTDFGYLCNGTAAASKFLATFAGYGTDSTGPAVSLRALVPSAADATDSSSIGLLDLCAFRTSSATKPNNGTLSAVSNRKILTVRDGTNDAAIRMCMMPGGRIGLGTLNPSSVSQMHIYNSANTSCRLILDTTGTGDAQQTIINMLTKGDGTAATGDAATQGWGLSARGNAWSTAALRNVLLFYYWNGTSYVNPLYILPSGFVGIGNNNSAPVTHLDVQATAAAGVREDVVRFHVDDCTTAAGYLTNGTVGEANFCASFAGYCGDSTVTAVQLKGLVSEAADASDSSDFGVVDLCGLRTDSATDPNNGTLSSLVNRKLCTLRDGTATSTIRMCMMPGGRIGFGTIAPVSTARIHVYYSENADCKFMLDTTGTGSAQQTVFNMLTAGDGATGLGDASTRGWGVYARGNAWTTAALRNMMQWYYWNGSAYVNSLNIMPTGLVGIGTTAPDRALEINSATGINLRLTYNDSNGSASYYADYLVSSAGNATITPSGGVLSVTADVRPATDNTYYLGKNDDDTPAAWKGVILKDQGGTGKYYRLEVYGDAVRIVDLTD